MHVLVTGGAGFIGRALTHRLLASGHDVTVVSRNPTKAGQRLAPGIKTVSWTDDPLPPADVVIHLAGESVAGRWTTKKREAILKSRVESTRTLVRTMGSWPSPPRAFLSASAIGFYGERGDDVLDETAALGSGFLPEVCAAWEKEALAAEKLDIPTMRLRMGLVLHPEGGALQSMLKPFKCGLGGRLGRGSQYWSWIHRTDALRLIESCIEAPFSGAINITAPTPVSQAVFAKTLARVLGRPAFLPAPAWALKAALGGFSVELLMSRRVIPRVAQERGFDFEFMDLEDALRDVLSTS